MLVCPSCCHLCYWWNAEWGFFPLRYIFSRGANSWFLSLFSFLLLQFFAEVWLYVLLTVDAVYVEQQQQGCFVWLKGRLPSTLNHVLPSYPPTEKWQNVVIEGNTQTAHGCVYADSNVGINFIISSATAHLSSRGLSYISQSDGVRLACLPKPHFTASLNLWPSMIAFKAFKPQHPSLSFIISVCGLSKKLMWGKNCHRGIQIACVWHQTYWPSMGMLFSLIYFQLLLLCLFMFFIAVFFFLLILLFPFLPSLLLFLSPLFLAVCLFVSLSSALWDLLPSCFTFLTMKQMLILIILLAEISLWSNLMLREQLLHSASQGDCRCACKCDLVTKAMQDTSLESCYT